MKTKKQLEELLREHHQIIIDATKNIEILERKLTKLNESKEVVSSPKVPINNDRFFRFLKSKGWQERSMRL